MAALTAGVRRARAAGLFAVLDAKRGDIASTMEAYGQAAFETQAADALTITPYMGFDVISPLTRWLRAGKGVYVVWISSNASGRAVQELPVAGGSAKTFSAALFEHLEAEAERTAVGGAIGYVLGATKLESVPEDLLRRAAARPLLIPGVGAQGGAVDAPLLTLLRRSPAAVVSSSRGICGFGDAAQKAAMAGLQSWRAYHEHVAEKIRDAAESLTC
jgi:orotidine-5'-phosphate decarboxylase